MFDNILLETDGAVAWLTVNRPDKRNAADNHTVEEIDQALTRVEGDPQVRVLVITGAGEKAFVAGADIRELKQRDSRRARSDTKRRQGVYTRIEQMEIPTIAAINGWALGTGLELAMACTLRVASDSARLGQPEVKLGITPGAGGTQRLPRLVGMGRAMELILLGDPVDAARALDMGLVNRVVPAAELRAAAGELAAALADRPPLAVQYSKAAILRWDEGSLAAGLDHESFLHALSCGTADKREGVAAFLEKRKPEFKGM